MEIRVRHTEPEDYEQLHRLFNGPKAIEGTLQLPFPSAEAWRKRLEKPPTGLYSLVATVEDEVVGSLWASKLSPDPGCGTRAGSGWPCATTGRAGASGRR